MPNVPCKFWAKGDCHKGNNCPFLHVGAGGNNQNRFDVFNQNQGNRNQGDRYRPGGSNSNEKTYNVTADAIELDLKDERPIWPFSAYGPGKDAPRQLFGGFPIEQSSEELRLRAYLNVANGNPGVIAQEEAALLQQVNGQIENCLKDLNGAVRYVLEGQHQHPNRHDETQEQSGTWSGGAPTSAFGSNQQNTQSAFGQPSQPSQSSAFGKPAFGQASQPTGSAFGQPSAFGAASTLGKPAAPAFGQSTFGQPSAFGKPAATSAFGQPSQPGQTSAFGQPSQPGQTSAFGQIGQANQTPAFGQPSQPNSTSTFGQPSQPGQTSAFGQPSQPGQSSVFGQPSQPAQNSAFGQPSQPGTTSAFGQPSQSAQTSAFGQPSQAGQSSAFGQASQPSTAPAFGQASQPASTSAFGKPAFGASPFGQANNTQQSQTNPSPFGQTNQPASSLGAFGQQKPAAASNPFGQQQSAQTNGSNGTAIEAGPDGSFRAISTPRALDGQGKVTSFKGTRVVYENWPPITADMDASVAASIVQQNLPFYQKGRDMERLWFPKVPETLNEAAEPKIPEGYDVKALTEAYKFAAETGTFKEEIMPELAPKREWVSFDL